MRHALVATFILGCGSLGCGSGGGSHPPDATGHADGPAGPDAPGADGSTVDATPPDAEITAALLVRVFDSHGAPLAGAEVIFVAPDGVTGYDIPTDASGTVNRPMPAGSSVTVVARSGTFAAVDTFTGLRLGATVDAQPLRDYLLQTVTFTWTLDPQMDQYQVVTSCPMPGTSTTTGSSLTTSVRRDCADPLDAIVVARDLSDVVAPDAQVVLGATPPVAFGDSWSVATVVAGQVTHVPTNLAGAATLAARALTSTDHLATGALGQSPLAANGTVTAPIVFPGGITPIVEVSLPGPGGVQLSRERFTAFPAPYNRDLDGRVLPWVGASTLDLATRTYTWTSTPPVGTTVAATDAVTVAAGYNRTSLAVLWTLHAPAAGFTATPTGGTIAFPDLPGDRDFEPLASDTISSSAATLYSVNLGADLDRLIERGDAVSRDVDVWGDPTLMRITTSSSGK